MYNFKIDVDNRTRGNAAYRTLYTHADVYRYSFFARTSITWNTIPPTLRQVNTIDQFQTGLEEDVFRMDIN
jgi:hypothetical protein